MKSVNKYSLSRSYDQKDLILYMYVCIYMHIHTCVYIYVRTYSWELASQGKYADFNNKNAIMKLWINQWEQKFGMWNMSI